MKNKLKILITLLSLSLALGLVACGEPSHTHTFSDKFFYDSEFHWLECECGEDKSKTAHSFTNNVCECGYEKTEEHVHDYSNGYKYDLEKHWLECECGNKTEENVHNGGVATETSKAVCATCNQEYGNFLIPEHSHDYKSIKYNELSHWLECECGDKISIELHKGGTATETSKAVCEICNQEYGNLLIPGHSHDYKSIKYNELSHWLECECGDKISIELHKGGTATEKEQAVCTICNQGYGNVLGHNYNKNTAVVSKVGNVYKVTLTCDGCLEHTSIDAEFVSEQVANCCQGGYKLYKYTFNNFDFMANPPADKNITVEFKPEDTITVKTNAHKIGSFAIAQGANFIYSLENQDELDALMTDGKLLWAEGEPGTCKIYKIAGFFCELCSTPEKPVLITFQLSGKHKFREISTAKCLTPGYTYNKCYYCDYEYYTGEELAKGHNYTYVYDSIDTIAHTIKVKCDCGDIFTTTIDNGTVYVAQNCSERNKTVYTTTTEISNGLPPTHQNYKLSRLTVNIYDLEQFAHTLASGYKFKQGETVEYIPAFDALIDAGKLLWTEGEPGACNTYKVAGFFCTACSTSEKQVLVTINLSGKHDFTGRTEVKATPNCTTRVANTTKCNSCNGDIVTSYTSAKGHELVADTADWNAFLLNPENNKTVTFTCDCGISVDITATVSTVNYTRIYTFTYKYVIQDKYGDYIDKVYVLSQEFN